MVGVSSMTRRIGVVTGRTACHAIMPLASLRDAGGAGAAIAEHGERVIAGVMAVTPGRGDRVLADQLQVHEPGLLGGEGRPRVEPARHARLSSAVGARTEPAQARRSERRDVAVRPADLEGSGGPIGMDPGGGRAIGHRRSIVAASNRTSGEGGQERLRSRVRRVRRVRTSAPRRSARGSIIATMTPADPHAAPAAAVADALGVDPAHGLGPDEAARRNRESGPNALEDARREPVLHMVVEAATEPFVVLLFVAGILAIALGQVRDGLLVVGGLVPIVGAEVLTEYRGDRALQALNAATAPTARVRRADVVRDIPAVGLVPGDVVLLRSGDVVPADLRLRRSERLLLDRSVLTGESVPEAGLVEPDPLGAPLAARRSIAYAGTSVVGGRGEGIVVAVGPKTEFGRIAGRLASGERRRSALQAELDRLVRILLVVAIGLIAIVTGLGFIRGQPAGENLLAGVSAAIAAIPEEPPILLAVILGLGAFRLLRRGVLVRRLNAEETLGAIDLIVTD